MFGRLLSSLIVTFAIASLLLIAAAQVALADDTINIDQEHMISNSKVKVHLKYITISDRPMGGTVPPGDPKLFNWAVLVHQFENTGDAVGKGYVKVTFYDNKGNNYTTLAKPPTDVPPHSFSDIRYFEVPIPKGTVLTKFTLTEGFDEYEFQLKGTSTATPTMMTATPTANPTQKPTGLCLPMALLPLLLIGGVFVYRQKKK